MYIPAQFTIKEDRAIFDVIKEHGFATVISEHEGRPFATHLPLILSKDQAYLHGHFARPNPQWHDIEGQTVLAIFQGPHCYISPSWYESSKEVPTWNYVTTHIYGEMELIDDLDSLQEMVWKYEAPNSSYQLQGVGEKRLANMSKGIQGFRIKITSMEGKAKLSQHHPLERQEAVYKQLEQIPRTDEQRIAAMMKENVERRRLHD